MAMGRADVVQMWSGVQNGLELFDQHHKPKF